MTDTVAEGTDAAGRAGGRRGRERRTSLALRIALLASVLVLLAVGASVVVTAVLGSRVANRAAEDQLDLAYNVQESFRDERYKRLWLAADFLALDPALAAYIAEAAENADTRSIADQLADKQDELGLDFAAVLTPDGRVLAHTDRPDAPGEDLSTRPLVARALTEYDASGVWAEGDRLYDAVVVSVARGLSLSGYLLLGGRIDDELAHTVEEASQGRVAYYAGTGEDLRLAGTTLDPPVAQSLTRALRERGAEVAARVDRDPEEADAADPSLTLELADSPWLARVAPLRDAAGAPVGTSVTLSSLDQQLATYRQLQWILTGVGAAAALLAIAFAYPLARRSLRPVRELAEAAEAARQGDYDRKIADAGTDEVGRLARTVDELLSGLREKRDMEAYMSHLSLSLPGPDLPGLAAPGGSGALAVPAAEDVVLLAVDLRRHARSPKDPERSVLSLQRDLDRITRAAAAEGGRPEAILGHRVLLSFVGPKAALRALSVAVPLVDGARREGAEDWQLPTVAVASGPAALGTVQWGDVARRGLIGLPVARVDSLLRDASPGEIVLAAGVRESLDDLLEERGLTAQARSGLVSSQRLYAVSPEDLPRLNDLSTAARTLFLDEPEGQTAATPAPTATGPIHVMDTEDAARVAAARAELPEEEAAVSRLGPGSLLGERFEIVSTLGTGGMGVVFKARDRELDEMIALKVLRGVASGDGRPGESSDQLKEELKLARRITHPNVLRTYDFGELDGVTFVSMEYVRGVTLRVLLDRAAEPLPFRAALRVVRQVSAGLAAAHEIGVIHRDVKPENVILDAAGNAKVMDFGIARTVTETSAFTRAGEVVGTPHYLAPERLKNEPADARSDVYSLGVMLYEIFVGRPPFPGGTLPQIITQHLHDEPPAPRTVREDLPEELERIVMRCLAKTPEERFKDAGALQEALGRVQG